MKSMTNKDTILKLAEESGAHAFALLNQADIVYDYQFREICMRNNCGEYGKCWMCPPDVGDVNELMKKAQSYSHGVLYNSVSQLEDSFDFEGMMEAKQKFNEIALKITNGIRELDGDILHLGVGACGICERCAKKDNEHCRFPDRAIPSMESHGIFVAETAKKAGLKYINGKDTVTYFGIVLFR